MPEPYKAPSFDDIQHNIRMMNAKDTEYKQMAEKKQWLMNYLFGKWEEARGQLDAAPFDILGKKGKQDQMWFDAFQRTGEAPMPLSTFRSEPNLFEHKKIDSTIIPHRTKSTYYRPVSKK